MTLNRGPTPRLLPWLLVLMVFWIHLRGEVATPYDSGWTIHMAVSLLRDGDLNLDEYRDLIPEGDYRVQEVNGHLVSRFPVAPAVVAAPVVAVVSHLSRLVLGIQLRTYLRHTPAKRIEKTVSSLLVALATLLTFRLGRMFLGWRHALLLALVFAFGTSMWSVVSRAMWQHSPAVLMLTAMLFCLLRARGDPRWLGSAGFLVAAAFAMRPTNALSVVAISAYVVLSHRRQLPRYLLGAAAVAAPFLIYSWGVFGTWLPPYFRGHGGQFLLGDLGSGLAGTLMSPGRGLFIYSPILLFSLLGLAIKLRRPRDEPESWQVLDTCLAVILVLHWVLISSWWNWWGGTVFGPRLFADVLPYLIYFMIPAVERLEDGWARRPLLAGAFGVLFLVSAAIHSRGATVWPTWDWNVEPTMIDQTPERLWDWRDPPFLRTTSSIPHND